MIPLYEFCNKTDQAVSLLNDTGSVPANTCQNVDQENYTFLLSCGVPADCFTLIPPIDLGDLENLTLDVAKFGAVKCTDDLGADGCKEFLTCIQEDQEGNLGAVTTEMDGTTPYEPVKPTAPIQKLLDFLTAEDTCIPVTVKNQLDLSTIEGLLQQAVDILNNIDADLDTIIDKLMDIIANLETINENIVDVVTALGDIINELGDVLAELGDVNTNLESVIDLLQDVLDCLTQGKATQTSQLEKLCDIITEAQDTNACLLEIKALLGEDTVEVIVDTECNDITGNYDFVTTTVTNGVAGTPVITDSGTPCTEDAPDYEQVSICNTTTGNTHIITSTIIDGVITVLDDTDTGNKCTPTKVESDVEVVCNDDTDLQEYHIFEIVDGVTNPVPTIVPTTIACDEDKVDYEQVEVCRNGTTHIVTNSIIDDVVTEIDAIDTGVECCKGTPECVESQEWTYGIDNTGTTYDRPNAEYEITLSDGSTLTWTQTTASAAGWSAQLTEWSQSIQASADAAGLAWFVEPRTVNNPNPTDISGNYGNNPTGLPGAPSIPVAQALINGGMAARYVNIQICPGQPVPVGAKVISHDDSPRLNAPYDADGRVGLELTTAGAVLGPIQKFVICRCCGKEPVRYLDDGVTLATEGQIPNCYEPCGTLSLLDSPPERECEFFFAEACDNVNQPDDNTAWTNLVTRRATVCGGEQIGVEYFIPDPVDPSALVAYDLVGDFVDCDTGEPIELPEPDGCVPIDQCWEGETDPTLISVDAAGDNAGFDYDSTGAGYAVTNTTADEIEITFVDIYVLNGNGSNATITLGGVESEVVSITADGVYRFPLTSPVTIAAGANERLVMGGPSNSGGWDHAESNTNHPFLRDDIAVSFYVGGGTQSYSVIVCPDGLRKAYDRFNNEVPFNLDGTWVQVECVSEAAKLCEIRDLLAKQEIEGERQCYERPTGFFDTLITFDSGNRPLSDDILVTPNETGTLTEIRLRVDNRNPGAGANSIHDTISFELDGQPLIPTQNLNFNPASPFGQQFDDARPGISEFRFEGLNLDVLAGQTYTISASLANGNDPLIGWQQQSLEGDANGQIEYTGTQDGNYPALHWIGEGTDRFTVRKYCDGTEKIFDCFNDEVEELPAGLEKVCCDGSSEDKSNVQCPDYIIYPEPLKDRGRDITEEENAVMPLSNLRNFAPWLPAWTNNPPFPAGVIQDSLPSSDITDGYLPGSGNVFRTRSFDLDLSADDIPDCVSGGAACPDLEVNIKLEIEGLHTAGGSGADMFLFIMGGTPTAPTLLDVVDLVGDDLIGPNTYELSATVPCDEIDNVRLVISLQTIETNSKEFKRNVNLIALGITVPGCNVLDVDMVHDQCAANQRDSANSLLNQIAQNTVPQQTCDLFDYYTIDFADGLEGLRNRERHDTKPAIVPFPTDSAAGRDFRETHDFSLTPDTDTVVNSFVLNDTNNTASKLDIQVMEGYVFASEDMLLRYSGGSEGYWAVELGYCCGALELVEESGGFSPDREMIFTIPKGTHQLRLWNIDSGGSNSNANLSYSTDGGVTWITDNTPPNLTLTQAKPSESCNKGYICGGAYFEIDKTTPLVLGEFTSLCPFECVGGGAGGTGGSSCEESDVELTTQVGTNSNVPAGAKMVTINNISGVTTINGDFELGTGRRVDSISFGGDRGNCKNEILPEYTLDGGTRQWIAHF